MKMPVYFLSHGGGPWPYMPEERESYALMTRSLRDIPGQLDHKPRAVLMVSAHWEANGGFLVMSNPKPPMLYDYYGFPEHTYRIQYSAPGSTSLAQRVSQLLETAGLPHMPDPDRGFDHGAFVPMVVMYPDADIPMVQLSIETHFNPKLHMDLGRAIAPLRDEGVLIIGSGLSYHNLREIRSTGAGPSAQFDAWLQQAVVQGAVDQRLEQLENWEHAPAARRAHPREDHLIPLMVAAGAAEQDPATCIYHDTNLFSSITASSFRFG